MYSGDQLQLLVDLSQVAALIAQAEHLKCVVVAALVHLT